MLRTAAQVEIRRVSCDADRRQGSSSVQLEAVT